jgi:hypothetical protein
VDLQWEHKRLLRALMQLQLLSIHHGCNKRQGQSFFLILITLSHFKNWAIDTLESFGDMIAYITPTVEIFEANAMRVQMPTPDSGAE